MYSGDKYRINQKQLKSVEIYRTKSCQKIWLRPYPQHSVWRSIIDRLELVSSMVRV